MISDNFLSKPKTNILFAILKTLDLDYDFLIICIIYIAINFYKVLHFIKMNKIK